MDAGLVAMIAAACGVCTIGGAIAALKLRAKTDGHDEGKKEARLEAVEEKLAVVERKVEARERAATSIDKDFALLKQTVDSMKVTVETIDSNVRALMYGRPAPNAPTSTPYPAPSLVPNRT